MLNRIKMWSRVSFVYRVPISPYIYQPSDIANKLPGFSIKTNRIYESLQHFLCSKVKDWKRCECWNWPDGLYLRTIRNIAENEKDVKMKRPGWFDNTSKIYFKKSRNLLQKCIKHYLLGRNRQVDEKNVAHMRSGWCNITYTLVYTNSLLHTYTLTPIHTYDTLILHSNFKLTLLYP